MAQVLVAAAAAAAVVAGSAAAEVLMALPAEPEAPLLVLVGLTAAAVGMERVMARSLPVLAASSGAQAGRIPRLIRGICDA